MVIVSEFGFVVIDIALTAVFLNYSIRCELMIYYFQGICTRVNNKEFEIDQAIEVNNIHTNIHTYIHTLCIYVCMYICICMYVTYIHTYIHFVHTYNMHTYIHTHTYIRAYIHTGD